MSLSQKLVVLIVLLAWVSPCLADQANLFVYHRFGDGRYPSTNISVEAFSEQLEWLKTRNYTVLRLGEVVKRLADGRPLPERCAVLTVDDGFESFLSGAMPLLRRYGYPATLFVATDFVGRKGYLNWAQLQQLAAEGVEIGNHSASHPYLLDWQVGQDEELWRQKVSKDILSAQLLLESHLERKIELFAYPYGEYSPQILEMVKELGFLAAVAQQSGVVGPESDRFALPRFPMGGAFATAKGFREKLAMKPLPAKVVKPAGPVLSAENPPELVFDLDLSRIDARNMRCYVSGQDQAEIIADPGVPGRYRVRAEAPLEGRRNKYTLTAPSKDGSAWHWFSQLWVRPQF